MHFEKGAATRAMAQFAVCQRPWNDYIRTLGRADDVPYDAEMNPKPMYRGRKHGFEEWNTGAGVQLHYSRYPDEHLITNLSRYRSGDLVGDIGFQQFRNAQPFLLTTDDPDGFKTVDGETYMKLNYKNPGTIGRYLTRTGHLYPQDILALHPHALAKLQKAKKVGWRLGLFPSQGNPFWFRSQEFRPKPRFGEYDPVKGTTKSVMASYAATWLQVDRVRRYFAGLEEVRRQKSVAATTAEGRMQGGYEAGHPDAFGLATAGSYIDEKAQFSGKNPTVPGLMSTAGLKKPLELYSGASQRRMGFPNPITKKKL